MRFLNRGILLVFIFLGLSCSSVTAKRVHPNDYDTNGVRYWLSAPYLLVRAPIEVARKQTLFELEPGSANLKTLTIDAPPPPNQGTPIIPPAAPKQGATLSLSPIPEGGMASAGAAKPKQEVKKKTSSNTSHDKAGTGTNTDGDKPDKEKGDDSAAGDDKPKDSGTAGGASVPTAVEIVWLPDYCQQYAISSRTVLATSAVKYTLAEGWQLSQLDTTADSTAVVNKLLDIAGGVITARAGGGAGGGGGNGGAARAAEKLQKGEAKYLRKIEISYLKPGLYQLFEYPTAESKENNQPKDAQCAALPIFSFKAFQFEAATIWEELPLVSKQ